MTTGAALLAALDAALPLSNSPALPGTPEAERREAGLCAAISLNDLLISNERSWDALMSGPGTRLAKLCGRLGSSYQAEREAAYDHAVRLLHRRGARWSDLVRLEAKLAEAQAPLALPLTVLPPEEDWLATVRSLRVRLAWRSTWEHDLLAVLDARLAEGRAVGAEEARQLRDMWWSAELNQTRPEEAA